MIKYNDFSNLNHLLNFKKIYKDKDILKIIIKFLKKIIISLIKMNYIILYLTMILNII